MAWSCDRIVRGLRRAGATIDVVHLTAAGDEPRCRPVEGGRLLRVPLGDDPEHALRRAWTDLTRIRPPQGWTHVVAFGGTHPLLAAPVWAAWAGAPLVTLLRGNDFDTGVLSIRRRSVLLDCLARSSIVCVVARSQVGEVAALVPGLTVRHVPNGIDETDWEVLPSEREKADAWRAEHVASHRRTIGVVGQLKAKKGVGWFLDRVEESGLADRAHVIAVGELDEALAARFARLHPDLSCSLLPFLDRFELLGVFPVCDLIALPSFYDGLPNVALEAAALGIPLLCSDAGGLRELVTDGVEGYRFAAGDAVEATEAICRALEAPDAELARCGAAARARVRDDFTAAAETTAYLAALGATASDAGLAGTGPAE